MYNFQSYLTEAQQDDLLSDDDCSRTIATDLVKNNDFLGAVFFLMDLKGVKIVDSIPAISRLTRKVMIRL